MRKGSFAHAEKTAFQSTHHGDFREGDSSVLLSALTGGLGVGRRWLT
jgi:hypothetical protein